MACYVGIDVGTSGVRACAIDADASLLATSRAPLARPEHHGAQVQQAPELWWQALEQALTALRAQIPTHTLRALALDATSSTTLLAGDDGQPLGPALMYNDSRARAAARIIHAHAPADSAAHGASSSLAKLLWLRARHRPQGRWRVLHQADWLLGRLCGDFGVSDENNALKLGYDPRARHWPAWLHTLLGAQGPQLPRVVPPGTPVGRLQPALARAWGLPTEVAVVAGTTDSVAGFLASGASQPGEAVTSLGSTLVLKVLSKIPVFEPASGIYSHRLGELWLAGGASNSGGAVLQQFFSPEALTRLSARLDPAIPSTLEYYPLPAPGERFPVNDPGLMPRMTPRPADDAEFLHGLLEAMAGIEARGYQRLQQLGAPFPTSVRSVGGGAANPAWTRIRARHLGLPMQPALQEEAAYGAALLARQGMQR